MFTLNNPDNHPSPVWPVGAKWVACMEMSQSGTPHLQGYVVMDKVYHLSGLKKISREADWENRKGDHVTAYRYCIKGEETQEVSSFKFKSHPGKYFVGNGVPIDGSTLTEENDQGKRRDLDGARALILGKRNFAEIVQDPALEDVLKKYPKWVQQIHNFKPVVPVADVALRSWQQDLMLKLSGPPDPRKILWYYETEGNVGKSFMATYLSRNHGALVISNGKTSDIAHVYDSHPIVVWDLSRSSLEYINYGPMEDIKNGRIFSPKYDSCVKYFPVPHVVVFANFQCPSGKFSVDRLEELDLGYVEPTIDGLVGLDDPDEHTRMFSLIACQKEEKKLVKEAGLNRMRSILNMNSDWFNRPRSPGMFDTNI